MLTVYRASAGSGKTHTLTGFYLELAFQYPHKFKEILAVTFTNKAAAEMKDRIVAELFSVVKNGAKSAHFATVKLVQPSWNEAQIVRHATLILRELLHNYSECAVSTIDSFVQRVIKAFTFEIGLYAGYTIEFDSAKLIKDLILELFRRLDSDIFLQDWLENYAFFKIEEGKNWDFRASLEKFALEIFREEVQAVQASEAGSRDLVTDLKQNLETTIAVGQRRVDAIAASVLRHYPHAEEDWPRNTKWVYGYLVKKLPSGTTDALPTDTVAGLVNEIDKWTSKKLGTAPIRFVYELLNPLLVEAISFAQNDLPNYLLARNIRANTHALGILLELKHILPEQRNVTNLLHISESNVLLRKIIGDNDAPYIYEKIGSKFQHILIDEFQDTSGFQWDNFKPLLLNMLAQASKGLIVGDIKQAIYRWRGGNWKLLQTGVKEQIPYVKDEVLGVNWRSRPNIVNFNNQAFGYLSRWVAQGFGEQYQAAIADAYSDVAQEVAPPKAGYDGLLEFRFYKQDSGRDLRKKWREEVVDELPKRIEALLEAGYAPSDITILTRKNNDSKQIVDILMRYMYTVPQAVKYTIVSADALSVAQAFPVRVILALMRLLLDPNDALSLAVLNALTQTEGVNNFAQFNTCDEDGFPLQLIHFFGSRKSFQQNRMLPLFEIATNFAMVMELDVTVGQNSYLLALEDIIQDYTRNAPDDLASFLNWWDENSYKFSVQISETADALQVMTIHKSKGLAFKLVFVPFCDWLLQESMPNTLVWTQVPNSSFNQFPILPVSFRKELEITPLHDFYENECFMQHVDALNMLYVAFTRAKDGLIVWGPFADSEKDPNDVNSYLRMAVMQTFKDFFKMPQSVDSAPNCELFTILGSVPFDKRVAFDSNSLVSAARIQTGNWREKLRFRTRSTDFFIQSIKSVRDKVNFGTLMHEALAKCRKVDNLPEVIAEMREEGRVSRAQESEVLASLNKLFASAHLKDWFSDKWIATVEQAILNTDGNILIPDRIIENESLAIVIDYKFGEPRPEHHDQVRVYMALYQSMNPQKIVQGKLYYATSDTVEAVV